MFIAAAIALCIIMLVAGFVAPTLSRHPQRGMNKVIGFPRLLVSKLPGPLGRWAAKPFDSTQKYANKSAEKGREGRGGMPV
jgi:hypothetical protein